MQRLHQEDLPIEREAPSLEALLPAAGAMTALCLMLLALLFII